jgi:hypothetical protein
VVGAWSLKSWRRVVKQGAEQPLDTCATSFVWAPCLKSSALCGAPHKRFQVRTTCTACRSMPSVGRATGLPEAPTKTISATRTPPPSQPIAAGCVHPITHVRSGRQFRIRRRVERSTFPEICLPKHIVNAMKKEPELQSAAWISCLSGRNREPGSRSSKPRGGMPTQRLKMPWRSAPYDSQSSR